MLENYQGTVLPASRRKIKKVYNVSITQAGRYFECREYDTARVLFTNTRTDYTKSLSAENRRESSIARTRQNVRGIVRANIDQDTNRKPLFLTLTFSENITDNRTANKFFKEFTRRFERGEGYRLSYISILEYQKRGSVHYHCLLFDTPFIPISTWKEYWIYGSIDIRLVDNNPDWYLLKYITKESFDNRLYGEKSYFCSRDVKRPEKTYHLDNMPLPAKLDLVQQSQVQDIKISNYIKYD